VETTFVLTVVEASRRLRISRNSAYEAVRRGELPSIRVGRRVLVPVAALEAMCGCVRATEAGENA
jgi:excisionase family DNA binding protein